jgi:hypothetical protein
MGGGGQVGVEHPRYPNVFALGDASSLPTSKTAAAVRKQAPVLAEDLSAAMQPRPLPARYDGYTCCPLITGYNSLIMAEFAYDGKLAPSFPLDPTRERYSMYLAQMHLLPCWQRRAQVARVLPEQLTGRYFWPFQAGCRLPKHGRSPFLASRTKSDCSRLS